MSALSSDEIRKIRSAFDKEVSQRAPSIAVVGVSGVGKSSTINAIFKTKLPISHTVACTKQFEYVDVGLRLKEGELSGQEASLRIIDAPGLGEDIARDPEYINMYSKYLPTADVIMWVLSARNRAVALDQTYLQRLMPYYKQMVFAVNQIDLVQPMNWNTTINMPSTEMERNITDIVQDRSERLSSITKTKVTVIPYSANNGYNLEKLFEVLIKTIPEERRWIFASLKNFSYKDFVPKALKHEFGL